MNRVLNKIALITGGSRGIGADTARLLAQEGATVIVTDILEAEGEALAKEIGGTFYLLDVSNESDWQRVIDTVRTQFGRLDILFNNAGIIGLEDLSHPQDPEMCSLETWHAIHQVNMDGVFLGCKYGIALMKQHGGSIINMSSRSGIVGIPTACAYASSKAAVRNHTKSVALYCANKQYNIRCNSLHPGAILTPLWEPMLGHTEAERKQAIASIASGIPLGHMGGPLDVAYAVLYLASDESKYVTGIELTLDGGILAGSAAAPKQYDDN